MALYAYSPQLHGSWGCAALTWFQLQWPPATAAKEMIPIVIAAILWGKNWQGLSVRFHSDNSAVVALLNSGSVRDDSMMHLMRCLTFVAASFNFIFSSAHIPGAENVLADALSRNKAHLFLSLSPQARTHQYPKQLGLDSCGILLSPRPSPLYTTLSTSTVPLLLHTIRHHPLTTPRDTPLPIRIMVGQRQHCTYHS